MLLLRVQFDRHILTFKYLLSSERCTANLKCQLPYKEARREEIIYDSELSIYCLSFWFYILNFQNPLNFVMGFCQGRTSKSQTKNTSQTFGRPTDHNSGPVYLIQLNFIFFCLFKVTSSYLNYKLPDSSTVGA